MRGPKRVARERDDALGRVYVLVRDGQRHSIEVFVTSQALSLTEPSRYRDAVLLAVDSDGRSEVQRVLGREHPPRRIELTSDGYVETL